jgi:hypothetical protein
LSRMLVVTNARSVQVFVRYVRRVSVGGSTPPKDFSLDSPLVSILVVLHLHHVLRPRSSYVWLFYSAPFTHSFLVFLYYLLPGVAPVQLSNYSLEPFLSLNTSWRSFSYSYCLNLIFRLSTVSAIGCFDCAARMELACHYLSEVYMFDYDWFNSCLRRLHYEAAGHHIITNKMLSFFPTLILMFSSLVLTSTPCARLQLESSHNYSTKFMLLSRASVGIPDF